MSNPSMSSTACIWYKFDSTAYSTNPSNTTSSPAFRLPAPLPQLAYPINRFLDLRLEINDSGIGAVRLTGLIVDFKPNTVSHLAVVRVISVERDEDRHVSLYADDLVDVRFFDRRFSSLRSIAYLTAWRPENELLVQDAADSGDASVMWQTMCQPSGLSDVLHEEHNTGLGEVHASMLCFVAAAMLLYRLTHCNDLDRPPCLNNLGLMPDRFDLLCTPARWTLRGLCRVSPTGVGETLKCLTHAPVIVTRHSPGVDLHSEDEAIAEDLLRFPPPGVHRWAAACLDAFFGCAKTQTRT